MKQTAEEIWDEVRRVAQRVPEWVRNSDLHQKNIRVAKEALDNRVAE